jgi:hypothetical protein
MPDEHGSWSIFSVSNIANFDSDFKSDSRRKEEDGDLSPARRPLQKD